MHFGSKLRTGPHWESSPRPLAPALRERKKTAGKMKEGKEEIKGRKHNDIK